MAVASRAQLFDADGRGRIHMKIAVASVIIIAMLGAAKADEGPNDGSFETECRLLMNDEAFTRPDCDKVFGSTDPLGAAVKIKCGEDDHAMAFAYWTNTNDEGIVVMCVPSRIQR